MNFDEHFSQQTDYSREGRAELLGLDPVEFARKVLGFEPDEVQRRVLDRKILRGMLNCTRQWGKSTVMAVKALHQAYCFPGTTTLVLAPSRRQAGLLMKKVRKFARMIPVKWKRDGVNEISMEFPNGSVIVGLPDNEDTIRGFDDVRLMLVDEAARVKDEVYYDALMPMLNQTEGALWLLSTPKGKRGFFHAEWAGREDWVRIQVTAYQCPRHKAEFLAEQKRKVGARRFKQEYLCEFLDSQDSLFSMDVVERSIRKDLKPLLRDLEW